MSILTNTSLFKLLNFNAISVFCLVLFLLFPVDLRKQVNGEGSKSTVNHLFICSLFESVVSLDKVIQTSSSTMLSLLERHTFPMSLYNASLLTGFEEKVCGMSE